MHKGNRKPVAAGRFYPKDKNVLAGLVWDLLQGCPRAEESQLQQTTGILVPHAGYPYSGTTAAAAFGYAQAAAPRRIWLVGPSHTLAFAGIALSGAAAFESPIGINPVSPVVSELAELPGFMLLESAHSPEHSLEVELPFIQTVWGEVPIVPLLIGNENDWEDVSALATSLRDFLQPGDFWVVSNDFTHYGSAFGYTLTTVLRRRSASSISAGRSSSPPPMLKSSINWPRQRPSTVRPASPSPSSVRRPARRRS